MFENSCNVLLIYPKFSSQSFWNYRATCELAGARCPAPPLGLITVAALLPQNWNMRLIDRNAESLTAVDLDWADLVMTGGMLPQQNDTLEIIEMCRAHSKSVVVGGPDATSSPHIYGRADFRVLGEAETIIEAFLDAWRSGAKHGLFEAKKFEVDVTRSPIPRFDLLNFNYYVYIGVQFSRGCPFNCEFCDIIELYGRVPRAKSTQQMLAELLALHQLGYRGHVDFVDDNLIGNKKALRRFLPELIAWQKARGYPFELSTEASINLADDDQLLGLMREANFFAVFVGIETPDPKTLIQTQKKQNTRRSLSASVHKIYQAGMLVVSGFIIGFDNEKDGVAEGMIECIDTSAIPVCMVGLLFALPNTQLTRRLTSEGRLHKGHDLSTGENGDQCTGGLNFETARPRRDMLTDYVNVLNHIYDPSAYFARVRRMGRLLDRPLRDLWSPLRDLKRVARISWYMTVNHPELSGHFWRSIYDCARHNPSAIKRVLAMIAFYAHLGDFSRYVIERIEAQIAAIDANAPAAIPKRYVSG